MHGNLPVAEPVSTTVTVGDPTTTTTSTAPKHGKLDLKNLRRKTKPITASLNVQVSQHDKQDMSSIKKNLDKKKEIKAQVEDMNTKPKSSMYQNIDDHSPSARASAKIDNPLNKPPVHELISKITQAIILLLQGLIMHMNVGCVLVVIWLTKLNLLSAENVRLLKGPCQSHLPFVDFATY